MTTVLHNPDFAWSELRNLHYFATQMVVDKNKQKSFRNIGMAAVLLTPVKSSTTVCSCVLFHMSYVM